MHGGWDRLLMTTWTATIAIRFNHSGVSPQLALQAPPKSDAVAMLSAGAAADGESRTAMTYTDAERLAQKVGNLPLAIDQAASYMKETGSSPREMLEMYEDNEVPKVSQKKRPALEHKRKN